MFYFFKKGKCIIEHTIRLAIWVLLTPYSALGANPSLDSFTSCSHHQSFCWTCVSTQ